MRLKEILKINNKSYTPEREIIFNAIKIIHHFDYFKLQKHLEKSTNLIGRASIFRTLNLFVNIGILKNICNKNGIIIYEYIDETNHHEHMKCKKCGKIVEFDDSIIHKHFEKIAKEYNFKLLNHSVNLEGLCSKCI